MGGPGSGGFRGYGWPPGSNPGPDAQRVFKAPKPRQPGAKVALNYRQKRDPRATQREYALQEARRYLKRGSVAKKAPRGWRKLKGATLHKEVVAMHYTLPVWLRCSVLEYTSCARKLVLVSVKGRLKEAAVNRRVSGAKPKLRKLMAFSFKDLYMK